MEFSEADIKAGVESAANQAQTLLQQNNFTKALQMAVAAPTGSKDQAVRDQAAQSVSNVLQAIKDADISKTLDALSEQERDATMKYLYRAMSLPNQPAQTCTKLLLWHEKLHEKDGSGIIMRTLVDRKING